MGLVLQPVTAGNEGAASFIFPGSYTKQISLLILNLKIKNQMQI